MPRYAPQVQDDHKWCPSCKSAVPVSAFSKASGRYDGLQGRCASCATDRDLMRRFGLTRAEYNAMLASQSFGCAVCGGLCSSGKRLAVDHNHATGQVRGLLCRDCNTTLGKLGDSLDKLMRFVRYLDGTDE